MLNQDSEIEILSRFVQDCVIWTQPSLGSVVPLAMFSTLLLCSILSYQCLLSIKTKWIHHIDNTHIKPKCRKELREREITSSPRNIFYLCFTNSSLMASPTTTWRTKAPQLELLFKNMPLVGVDKDMKSSHDLTLPDVVFGMKGHSGLVVESHVRHALSSFNMSSLPTI